ncbi:MAG: 50S ribosomal protein L10 [Actinomycetota bacterium]
MVKKEKKEKVEAIKKLFSESNGLIFTDHTGLSVEGSVMVRDRLAENDAYLKILKNTLALIAAGEAFKDLDLGDILKGPTSVVASSQDIIEAAKVVKDFAKDYDTLKIKGGILEDQLLSAEKVKKIAELPSREVLLTNLVVSMNSPITRLAMLLGGLPRNLVVVLEAIRKEKEKVKN